MGALFGPSGNSEAFFAAGKKHTYEEPEWIASLGLDAFEYSAGNGITGSMAVFEKIGAEAKKHNILLSFHTPYFISLSGIERETRLKSLNYIKQSVAAAEAMGADIIVIHAGSASKISREEATELAKDTLWRALEDNPDTTVRFGVETMGKKNQLGTLDEVLDICSIDRRLCPVVDFGHLNARDCGHVFDTTDDYMRVFDKISDKLGPDYAENLHCHFSKIEYTAAGEKKHLTFEDEVYGPRYEPLSEAIALLGVSPRIMCESQGTQAADALMMKKHYLSIIGKERG